MEFLNERARDEIGAIKSIFMDDFKVVEENNLQNAWKKSWKEETVRFLLCLKPMETSATFLKSNKQVYAVIMFQVPRLYPTRHVILQLQSAVGISAQHSKLLENLLLQKAKEMEGQEMIYELASIAREFLSKHADNLAGDPDRSLYDNMLQRQQLHNKMSEMKILEEKEKFDKEKLKENELLTNQIEEEITRKKHRVDEEKRLRRKLMEDDPAEIKLDTNTQIVKVNPSSALYKNEAASESSFALRYSYGPAAQQNNSRYLSDFYEIESLGKGSYGSVVKAQNRLDGRFYAIKKLKLDSKDHEYNKRMTREVTTLSRLHHAYVVRYYQAWVEGTDANFNDGDVSADEAAELEHSSFDDEFLAMTGKKSNSTFIQFEYSRDEKPAAEESVNPAKSSKSWAEVARSKTGNPDRKSNSQSSQQGILYIQMEYCEKNTLKDSIRIGLTVDESWRLFRQILEGLVHIHSQGMVHRDLKPTNIFLDANGDVKIGDFGLATNLEYSEYTNRSSGSPEQSDDDMTTGVGTSLYMAPEISGKKMKYDQKVDIYSLGIIFFECVYRFDTEMERVKVLKNLRRPDLVFPLDYKASDLLKQTVIIKWLLKHNSSERPTSFELLQSEHLPPRVENELINETLRTISQSNTPFYSRLMSVLFSQQVDHSKDFTFDFNSDIAFHELKSVILSKVKEVAMKVFTRHGAIEFSSMILAPKSDVNDQKTGIVRLLDADGTLVELPYDLTAPFARWVARSEIIYLKRWCFDRVYRQNISGGQPRTVYEADFDIIHTTPGNMAYEAEVLKTVTEILDELPPLKSRGYYIRLNHSLILNEILDKCKIANSMKNQVCSIIINYLTRFSWAQIERQLFSTIKLSASSVSLMEKYMTFNGPIELAKDEFGFNHIENVFKELKKLEYLLRNMGVTCPVVLSPISAFNHQHYKGGVMFQVVLNGARPDIVAAGGRYDKLISSFKHPSSSTSTKGVGVNLAIAKLATLVESTVHGSNHSGPIVEETKMWVPRACDIMVASFGPVNIAERLSICTELWNANLSVDYLIEDGLHTIEELQMLCKSRQINWIVILKEHPRDKKHKSIKLKNIILHREIEVRKEELVDAILSQMKELDRLYAEKLGLSKYSKRDRTTSTVLESRIYNADESTISGSSQHLHHEKMFEVNVVNNPKFVTKSKVLKNQQIVDKAIRSVSLFFEGMTPSTSKPQVDIIAVDLRLTALQKLACCPSVMNDETFRKDVIESFPPLKEYLVLIRSAILELRKVKGASLRFIFLYSHFEDHWEILKFN